VNEFIITVDTEEDNLWQWKYGDKVSTRNAYYIQRFQELCEDYGLKPVYLVDYEMAQSDELCRCIRKKAYEGKCEIGMHLHAWNTPPMHELPIRYDGCPYITEYMEEVIFEKHRFLKQYIEEQFELKVVSYRSGRWATNDVLFRVLESIGFLVDCSVTPGNSYESNVGMSVGKGNSYIDAHSKPYRVLGNLIEVPMTTRRVRGIHGGSLKNRAVNLIKGEELWLRPSTQSLKEMKRLMSIVEKENAGYAEFMIHSSELMPGGSPYCRTEEDVENMYMKMDMLFKSVADRYSGATLSEYYKEHSQSL
jgi:hypothetical protein